jgi:small subunit ribosomal protein S10
MMAKKKEKEETPKQKIRIKLKAYDHKVIDNSAKQIVNVLLRHGAKIEGPIPLPTEIHKYTVNRDVFVHKDSREQFEIRIHKRLIEVYEINQRIIDALQTLNLPAGVDIEIKM